MKYIRYMIYMKHMNYILYILYIYQLHSVYIYMANLTTLPNFKKSSCISYYASEIKLF